MKASILKKDRDLFDALAQNATLPPKQVKALNDLRDRLDRAELLATAKRSKQIGLGYLGFRTAIESVVGPDRVVTPPGPVPGQPPSWYITSVAAKVRDRAITVDKAVAFAESLGPGKYSLLSLASGNVAALVDGPKGKELVNRERFEELPEFEG